jgi:predicted nucleotidyltransferase
MTELEERHHKKIVGILKVVFGDDIEIYAYGSRARHDNRPSSDLDLMIKKSDEKLDLYDLIEARELLAASNLPFLVDPHDYNATDPVFLSAVSKDFIKLTP